MPPRPADEPLPAPPALQALLVRVADRVLPFLALAAAWAVFAAMLEMPALADDAPVAAPAAPATGVAAPSGSPKVPAAPGR